MAHLRAGRWGDIVWDRSPESYKPMKGETAEEFLGRVTAGLDQAELDLLVNIARHSHYRLATVREGRRVVAIGPRYLLNYLRGPAGDASNSLLKLAGEIGDEPQPTRHR